MTDQRDPLILAISFSAAADGAWEVRWEAPEIGARRSRLAPPYQGAELELVVRALDALHGAGISFSAADAARLAALGLARANGLPAEDMHRRVGRALYRALIADDAGSRALDGVRNVAVATSRPLAISLRFPPEVDLATGLQVRYFYFAAPLALAAIALVLGRLASAGQPGRLAAWALVAAIAAQNLALWYSNTLADGQISMTPLTH